MKRVIFAVLGLATLGAVLATSAGAAGKPQIAASSAGTTQAAPRTPKAPKTAKAPATPRAPGTETNFLSVCKYSHRGPDDPIVFPNMPGQSHSHDFFSNITTAANSTYDSLRHGGTTCRRTGDTAGYWVPTLYVDGVAIDPVSVNAYYRTGGKDAATVQAPPAGLKVVAGNSKATGPQSAKITSFKCGDETMNSATAVPLCPDAGKAGLHMRVLFPDCWNGHDLDSADHKSHMAYSVRGVCAAGYPVPVAQLTLNVKYPTTGGPGVTLASGPFYTAHADFFNAWDQAILESLVHNCINADIHCGAKGTGAP